MQTKTKKTNNCGFLIVGDPGIQKQIKQICGAPDDATNYIFWFNKTEPSEWGLTLKSIPQKDENSYFTSQHVWKLTWVDKGDKLERVHHSRSIAQDVEGTDYENLVDIFKTYKGKRK